ncbi:MAG: hypothetical protein KJO21_08655 [Verrucomicrobiae bacterium]|nr:hypothetical protein [Verrucomicrobiae bacterium]NNJ42407.1 hypothetical protein [Akkermansiaceae bacterium]
MKHLITCLLLALALTCPAASSLPVDNGTSTAKPASTPEQASAEPDRLRFINHDTLHGNFLSFGQNKTMLWKNPEADAPIHFSTQKIQRVILNHGQGHQSTRPSSTVTLVNGDIIPGQIIAANQKSITFETDHLGTLTLPRDSVAQMAPTPYGGKILYYGPLNTDGWKTLLPPQNPTDKKNKNDHPKINLADEKAQFMRNDPNAEPEIKTDWKHIASAWYSGTDKNRYLTRKDALPDKCRFAFKLGWRGSLYCNIAIHADFSPPHPPKNQNDEARQKAENHMASTVGHAYVVSLSKHSANLYACTFDKDGNPSNTRINSNRSNSNLNLSAEDEAEIELRIDRPNKQLLFYLNGDFKTKWDLGDHYVGTGNHLAFRNLRYSNAELRISDIIISRWNGLKDSAQSMRTPDRDVILLTNGVDRFSGQLSDITHGKVAFRGNYNSDLSIPIDEVQAIHFASNHLRKLPEEIEDVSTYFYIHPYGRISGIPSAGNNGNTKLLSNLLGELSLDTRYVNIIDFSHQNSLLDLWDDNF